MAEMRYLSVRNLAKYQHYRERRPIWVKLYQKILEDVEFTCLQDASKAHAILIILIASRYDNRIPWDARWIGHAIHASEPVDLDALVNAGFLVPAEALTTASKAASNPASKTRATRKRSATPKRREKREENKSIVASDDARSGTADAPNLPPKATLKETWLTPFADAWRERFGGEMAMGAAAKALKPLVDEWGADEARRRWTHYLAATEGSFANAARFAATFGEWNAPRVKAAGTSGPAKQADAAYLRAAALWPIYRRLGFISAIPNRERVKMTADDMVAEGHAATAEAFVAELRVARPWDYDNVKSDAYAIDQIAQRLREQAAKGNATSGVAA